MFDFSKSDFQRLFISTVGALAMSATCVFAAVGPAKASTPIASHSSFQFAAADEGSGIGFAAR